MCIRDRAGVVEPAVKLLTKSGVSKDIMEMVGQMICNVAITNKSVRAIVHRAGGLSIAVKMLQSKDADIRRQAVAALSDDLPSIILDGSRLSKMLMAIRDNSVKFSDTDWKILLKT